MKKRIYFYTFFLLVTAPLFAFAFQGWRSTGNTTAESVPFLSSPSGLEAQAHVIEIKPRFVSHETLELFRELLEYEPTVQNIHEHVVRAHQLDAKTYARWHKQSRLKALLPDFNFGKDFSESNNIDLDRGSTSTPDQYIFGPNDINKGWDFSVSWDLGDFIWTSSQTSIDSRQKIAADLRREFLADANKIYFERRQTQRKVLFEAHDNEALHFELLIMIDELTGLLDAMTDGWYGEKIRKVYEEWPEFYALWEYPSEE